MLAAVAGSSPDMPDPSFEAGVEEFVIDPPVIVEHLDGESGMTPDCAEEWSDPVVAGDWPDVVDDWSETIGDWSEVVVDWPDVVGDWPAKDESFGPSADGDEPILYLCSGMPTFAFSDAEAEVTAFTVADEPWFDAGWEFPADEVGEGFVPSDDLLFSTQFVQRGFSAGLDEAGGAGVAARPQASRLVGDFAIVASWLNMSGIDAEAGKLPGGKRRGR